MRGRERERKGETNLVGTEEISSDLGKHLEEERRRREGGGGGELDVFRVRARLWNVVRKRLLQRVCWTIERWTS